MLSKLDKNQIYQLIRQVLVLVSKLSISLFIILALVIFILETNDRLSVKENKTSIFDYSYYLSSIANKSILYIDKLINEMDYEISPREFFAKLRRLESENSKLLIENHLLKTENDLLLTLTKSLPKDFRNYYSARVVSRNTNGFIEQAYIKSPQADKLAKYDIVVNEFGLVGQVDTVEGNIAEILLLTDRNSFIPVKTAKSGKRAILKGEGGNKTELDFIISTKNLSVGEEILTSGDGGFFPADVPVGYISAIEEQRVYIETYVNTQDLDYVFIIK